ncbi:hypothetical protein KGF57_003976 [Candida theae]|uniref:Mis12 domain-containing protein n=1 Tax=Candida theae TaxID=1198502 RepID=A0AAD5BC35_9ASCO|nr:uncharacterized protein KGF57_003976 [Candida theae]KAI5953767.1 hypothetical protein KGF57_003976 [Candida theae]
MSNIEYDTRATALLTEHLGFAPIKVVDEVINAVNQIMVQGIEALENYLTNVHAQGQLPDTITHDEILAGTAKLESLLQYRIDFAFDKYELYCLTNIFHVPRDLITDGWFRLRAHEGIDFMQLLENPMAKSEYDDEILKMNDLIRQELYKRRYYKLQLVTFDKIREYLELVSDKFGKLYEMRGETMGNGSEDDNGEAVGGTSAREILTKLNPIDLTLAEMILQLKDVIKQVEIAKGKLSTVELKKVTFDHGDEYVEKRGVRILKDLRIIASNELNRLKDSEVGGHDAGDNTDINMFENIPDWDIVNQEVNEAKESRIGVDTRVDEK